jgi:hypothetical protein
MDFKGGGALGAFNSSTALFCNSYYNGTNYIYKASTSAGFYQIAGNQHQWYNAASGTAGNTISFTQAMTLDASGNLLLGTTTLPSNRKFIFEATGDTAGRINSGGASSGLSLEFANNGTLRGGIGNGSGNITSGAAADMAIQANANLVFASGGYGEKARIDSSGNLLVGTTSTSPTSGVGIKNLSDPAVPQVAVVVNQAGSSAGFSLYNTNAGAYRFFVTNAGVINATSTTITGISDVRFKENIRDLDDGLEKVLALKPRKFDWKEGKGEDKKNARGFIAQELETVFPDMVTEWLDPAPEGEESYKAVNANLIPTLVKAIQEQQALITQLQADVAALKGTA